MRGLEQLATGSRDLDVPELEQLVDELAGRPQLWQQHVRHARDERIYLQLHRDPHLDIWLICWGAAQETGLHDHDRSAGAVRVIQGTLLEDWLALRNGAIVLDTREHRAGSRFGFDASHIHDVRHDGGEPAVSLHAYSPALWRMGHYAMGKHGLGRVSLSYVDEVAA